MTARITTLELPKCGMKGQDAERLAGVLAHCPALAHLDLSGNSDFGAGGAERFAGVLGQCRELVHLNLCSSGIDAAGAAGVDRRYRVSCFVERPALHAQLGFSYHPRCLDEELSRTPGYQRVRD
jgi:hypothetical protein